jgi:hypothetical protein
MEEFASIASIVFSGIALVVSIKAWHKSRTIYGVERSVVHQYSGSKDDQFINQEDLNKKLGTGDYTILAVMERKADKDWEILLGRIKPYKESSR